jgi:hypothetical protein
VSDDTQDIAARFWAQLLGFEISSEPPTPGSPLWGMQLVHKLALAPAMPPDEASRVVKSYLKARTDWDHPDQEPPFEPRA